VANHGPIVVIGAGLAGLFTALRLSPRPVTVIAAEPLGEGASSAWAQGGIAAAVGEGDSPEAHAADTIRVGAGLVDPEVARMVAGEAPDRVRDLLGYGVPFDRDLDGHFLLSREAAHSAKRIVRVSGDRAGHAIMQALIAAVRQLPLVHVLEGFCAIDLITRDGRVTGVRLAREDDPAAQYDLAPAAAVVLATGGVGGLYAVTTNPPHARGEGMAIAARAGAVIRDAEFVQFHPTAIDIGVDPAPLATEALRGEGAILVNRNGERFMAAVHADAELAPRDVVARAVFREIAAGRGAFLDCRAAIGARFSQSYPTVYARCREAGLDPATQVIPVAPAEHYHMGGVKTDAHARTSVPGLWAVGEVASTGLHGGNRLASNSLIEAVVFGARAAEDIARETQTGNGAARPELLRSKTSHLPDIGARAAAIAMVRATMAANAGVERNETGLVTALDTLSRIREGADGDIAVENAVLAARFIVECALRRRESRGAHCRSDYPDAKPEARSSSITLAGLELRNGLAHALLAGLGRTEGRQ
jgi:L-aspartate oxidase